MCCCGKPTKNGEPGYSWDGKAAGVRPIDAPALAEGDTLLFDEPGRCAPSVSGEKGQTDYHSQHYRVVAQAGSVALLVKHGGGEERLELGYSYTKAAQLFAALPSSDARYLLASLLFHVNDEAERAARDSEAHRWRAAIADGRAKKRRYPKRGHTKVWIEDGPRVFDVSA